MFGFDSLRRFALALLLGLTPWPAAAAVYGDAIANIIPADDVYRAPGQEVGPQRLVVRNVSGVDLTLDVNVRLRQIGGGAGMNVRVWDDVVLADGDRFRRLFVFTPPASFPVGLYRLQAMVSEDGTGTLLGRSTSLIVLGPEEVCDGADNDGDGVVDEDCPVADELYGCAWNVDNLDNVELGPNTGQQVAYRFRAEQSGDVDEVLIYLAFAGAGYYDGDGGDVLLELQEDDGTVDHLPSGVALTSALVTDPLLQWNRLFSFSSPATLVEGELYHLVFFNDDPNPAANWVSTDCLYVSANVPGVQPAVSDTDLATLWKYDLNYPWTVLYYDTPIFDLRYTDGYAQGQCYVDAWVTAAPGDITGIEMIREQFTVSSTDREVSDVSVRLKHVSGTGDLTIRLEDDAGTLIEAGTVAQADIDTDYDWITLTFATNHTLTAGDTYHLQLSAPAAVTYKTYPLQDGTFYGFDCSNLFHDGHYEYTDGGPWGMIDNRTDFDLQFYFTVVGP